MSDHRIPLSKLAEAIRGHSIFSPSGSFMWAYCSGSLVPNIQIQDTAGIEAATGTVAHGVGELWIKTKKRPTHLLGTVERVIEYDEDGLEVVYEIEIDEEMLNFVQIYVDWCIYLPGDHFVEVRVDFSDITPIPNQGGTADHAACEPGRLTITDLKYGIGIEVYAEDNTQALLYAYGFFRKYDFDYDFQEIVIRICQPRRDHLDEWVISRELMLQWIDWLRKRAYLAWRYDAPRSPSEKACQWCKIKSSCMAYAVWFDRMTDDIFENLDKPIQVEDMQAIEARLNADGDYIVDPTPVGNLTLEHKVAIYRNAKLIKRWLDEIGNDLYRALMNGEEVPGHKLVAGRSTRAFVSKKRAIDTLMLAGLTEDEAAPRVLLSPAQAELALTKKGIKRTNLPDLLGGIIRKNPGSYTMVSSRDKRSSSNDNHDNVFENLDEV